ncbi:MAG: CSLREA domain-containing protein [Lysobacteraceae bacterium]
MRTARFRPTPAARPAAASPPAKAEPSPHRQHHRRQYRRRLKRLDGVIGASHSLIGDGAGPRLNGTNTANLGGDAKLAALGGNGGRTITHYPMPGSPLIDAVVCDLVPDTSQDQRGVTRPQGVRCDIGAVEADQIVVDTTADNTSADGLCSLREAIVNANSNGQTHTDCAPGSAYDIITFDPTVFANANASTIVLGALLPNIATDLLIDGTRADGGNVAISGNNARGVFVVLSSRSVSLRKLGIVKGRRSGNGGGIVNQGTLSIEHSTVSGNRAGDGGGIHSGGTLVIRHSTVTENISMEFGGGVRDNGGTADGGVDTSDWHVFAITVGKGLDVGVSIPSAEPISNLCRFDDYAVLVENLGTVVANAVQVDIPLPDSLPSANWTCTPVGGATCPPSGSGPIEHSVNLPRNAGVIYRITGLFSPGPEPDDTFIAHAFISGDVFPDNDIATAAATACLFSDGYEGELE